MFLNLIYYFLYHLLFGASPILRGIQRKVLVHPHLATAFFIECYHIVTNVESPKFANQSLKSHDTLLQDVESLSKGNLMDAAES